MQRQVGDLVFDKKGIAQRGVLVRHLVLPNNVAASAEIAKFLAEEVSKNVFVNIMDQYRPEFKASSHKALNRCPTKKEYQEAVKAFEEHGLWRFDHKWIKYHNTNPLMALLTKDFEW